MIFRRARGTGYRGLRRKEAGQYEGRAHASSTYEWTKAMIHKIGLATSQSAGIAGLLPTEQD